MEAVHKPREVAVIKLPGHSKAGTKEAKGNQAADVLAKRAGGYQERGSQRLNQMVALRSGNEYRTKQQVGEAGKQEGTNTDEEEDVVGDRKLSDTADMIFDIQEKASPQDKSQWLEFGAFRQQIPYQDSTVKLWRSADGRMVAPSFLVRMLIAQAHGPTHVGKLAIYTAIRDKWWSPYLKEMMKEMRPAINSIISEQSHIPFSPSLCQRHHGKRYA